MSLKSDDPEKGLAHSGRLASPYVVEAVKEGEERQHTIDHDLSDRRALEEFRPEEAIASRFGSAGKLLAKLFDSGVEARGVERVPEEERDPRNTIGNLFLWWSVNAVLTTLPIGCLAQLYFTLALPHAIAVIACFAAVGSACAAFIATLGPQTGMRTMVISRYAAGWAGGSIFAVFNILTELGFSVTCVILGGQTLASINDTLPLTAAIIIIAVCTLVICFFGYSALHRYERFAWMVLVVIFCMLYGLGGKAGYNLSAQKASEDTGRNLAGDVLSFGGVVFGSASGWAPVAADYNVKLPSKTSPAYVFLLTWLGLFIPIFWVETLGACLMTIPGGEDAYNAGGAGALLSLVLSPWGGFGKFLLVILSLSVIGNNIPNTYSTALSIQALGRPFQLFPRALWTVLVAVAYTVAGVAGRAHFSEILNNFLSILSYWTAFFVVIVAEEHFIFRRKSGYDFDAYDQPRKLPLGIAGILATCCGIAGAVVGMSETWYKGPIALLIANPYGADLGFELAAVFAAVAFPPLRWAEIRLIGR